MSEIWVAHHFAFVAGLALDGTALLSEGVLLLMGEKGAISSAVNALNGGAIYAISPKNPAGAVAAGCAKIIAEVE